MFGLHRYTVQWWLILLCPNNNKIITFCIFPQNNGCNHGQGGPGCALPQGVDMAAYLQQQAEQQQYETQQMAEKIKVTLVSQQFRFFTFFFFLASITKLTIKQKSRLVAKKSVDGMIFFFFFFFFFGISCGRRKNKSNLSLMQEEKGWIPFFFLFFFSTLFF